MQKLIEKAGVLIEALPYIQKFAGRTFVIKYGGSAMVDEELKESFARDVVMMKYIGINPVIVHGGGPQISEAMKKKGLKPHFVSGYRYTDPETMGIIEKVLGGKVNREIVKLIKSCGGRAVGLRGNDGGLIKAKKKLITVASSGAGKPETVDIGLVGEVAAVDGRALKARVRDGLIPVIAPMGVGKNGETYNINADISAAAVAKAVGAEKLILLTDTKGILDKDGMLIPTLTRKEFERLMRKNVITGGMLPKVASCFDALSGGTGKVHIVDGRVPHALLLEIFTDKGIGTEILV